MVHLLAYLAPSFLVPALLLVTVAYVVVGALVNYSKLRRFPGPPLAGFSKIWLLWQGLNARVHTAQYEAIQKYGSPCRIGPDLLVIDDPEIIRHLSAPRSQWRRGPWYEGMKLDPRKDSVFSTRDEKLHTELRAKMMGAYLGRDVDNIDSTIDERVLELLDLIRTKYNRVSMDISYVARYFTLDVLSSIAFGRKFGYMEANYDMYDYNKVNGEFFAILELILNHDLFRKILTSDWMQSLAAPKLTDKTGVGPLLLFAHNAVKDRFAGDGKERKDMLGFMLSKGMDQQQCEVEAFLQILAGSDSTTTVVRSTLYLLAGTPTAYAKLRAEVDEAEKSGKVSSPVVGYREAENLPYLQACIWEGLRVYPPLFGLKAKVAPAEGDTIKGVYYPRGTQIAICDQALCRRKDVFGDDADIFRPDRWIEADKETRTKMQQTVDCIFGTNKWSCLGKHIALVELNKTYFELFRNFDWALADPMRGIDTFAHGVHQQSNMNMVAYPRNRS